LAQGFLLAPGQSIQAAYLLIQSPHLNHA